MVNVDVNHFDALLTELGRHEVTYDFPNGMRADWVRPDQLARMAGRISTLSVSAESGDHQQDQAPNGQHEFWHDRQEGSGVNHQCASPDAECEGAEASP